MHTIGYHWIPLDDAAVATATDTDTALSIPRTVNGRLPPWPSPAARGAAARIAAGAYPSGRSIARPVMHKRHADDFPRLARRALSTDPVLHLGELVHIEGLVQRTDLNSKPATVLQYHACARRWEVLVWAGPTSERAVRVRVARSNLFRDHLLVRDAGAADVRIERSEWESADPVAATRAVLAMLCARGSGCFSGRVFYQRVGRRALRANFPMFTPVFRRGDRLWDAGSLLRGLTGSLLPGMEILLSNAREHLFDDAVACTIPRVRGDPNVVGLIVRTAENAESFAALDAMSGANAHDVRACQFTLMQGGVSAIDPVGLIAFHRCNHVKLRACDTTVSQAVRSICMMVKHGGDHQTGPLCSRDTASLECCTTPCALCGASLGPICNAYRCRQFASRASAAIRCCDLSDPGGV